MASRRGVGIVTYNRAGRLGDLIEAVLKTTTDCLVVVADDGSTDETPQVVASFPDVLYVRGPNKGVAWNKNRALYALQGCDYIALLEDDLFPTEAEWFEMYELSAAHLGVHHFCRVQEKEVQETLPLVTMALERELAMTPIYGPSPRGDFTFITRRALQAVGGLHPDFLGAGHAHGEWSERIARAGLIPHPLKWMDIREARDCFEQRGDREGGRFAEDSAEVQAQIERNRAVRKRLRMSGVSHVPLEIG
jgi:glycosyltransferase involved in cell wall biosynthesis